jgi:hypothetical protein
MTPNPNNLLGAESLPEWVGVLVSFIASVVHVSWRASKLEASQMQNRVDIEELKEKTEKLTERSVQAIVDIKDAVIALKDEMNSRHSQNTDRLGRIEGILIRQAQDGHN